MSFWLDGKFCCVDKVSESVFNNVLVPFLQNISSNKGSDILVRNLVRYKVSHDIEKISLGDLYAMTTSCLGDMVSHKTATPEAITLCQEAQKEIEKIIYSMNKMYL